MTHSLEWLVAGRVLYSRVWGEQTLDDVHLSNIQLKECLEAGTPLVHLIMDTRDMVSMPKSLRQMQDSLEATRHPSLGWVVTIGTTNPVTKYMGMMLAKIFQLRFRRVLTIQDAVNYLHEVDPHIDWSPVNPDILPLDIPLVVPKGNPVDELQTMIEET